MRVLPLCICEILFHKYLSELILHWLLEYSKAYFLGWFTLV